MDINDITKFDKVNFIDKYVEQWQRDTDDMYYKFLTQHGYKIDKPYRIEQIKDIMADIQSKGKFINIIEYIDYSDVNSNDNYTITRHLIPFFDNISYPLSEEAKQDIIKLWKENNK